MAKKLADEWKTTSESLKQTYKTRYDAEMAQFRTKYEAYMVGKSGKKVALILKLQNFFATKSEENKFQNSEFIGESDDE